MKIVMVSNYFNHHQSELAAALDNLTHGSFYFISTSEMREERRKMGYEMDSYPAYVVQSHRSAEEMEQARSLIEDADAVILGAAPEDMVAKRIKAGKLVFRYTERPLKQGISLIKYIPRRLLWHLRYPNRKPIYLLGASAFAAADYAKFGIFKGKAYKWGYFPIVHTRENIQQLIAQKKKTRILCASRLIGWKHVEHMILVAQRLKENKIDFKLRIIGTGSTEPELKQLVQNLELNDVVEFLGVKTPDEVRSYMNETGIFVLNSDRTEGWGAVINEAMNSGCAVVASHAIGSVPYLIHDGENGCIYRSGDLDMLYEQVSDLLLQPQKQDKLGQKAYQTMTELWNADTAAKRLIELAQAILEGQKSPLLYEDGPCSKAEILSDNWL